MTKAKILVIEDNFEVRENLEELLGLYGYQVLTAAEGKEGIKLALEHIPDLILCDIMMPGLDGYGVLQILTQQPETSMIPFVYLSAKTESTDVRKGMNLGADDYITKPFEESVLLQAIDMRLQKSKRLKDFSAGDSGTAWNRILETLHGLDKLQELTDKSVCRHVMRKEIIFQQGDKPLYLYQVVSGKIKLYWVNHEGKEITTTLLKEGDYFAYEALLKDSVQIDSAETLEESEIRLIPREDFLRLIFSEKDVASAFIKLMSNNIFQKEKQLLELAYNTVRKRVADALIRLQDTYATGGGNGKPFGMSISRDDLASIVGTSTESAIRMLSEFKSAGLIDIKGSEIIVLQPEKLRKAPY
jgi:CRP-like cAMP-binding protein/CheY-like chemotaxis protein